ncbi:hypothetical protein BCR33DRAFT_713264 [Rhizoclosmatium globosum]|uniref:Uncharacterized protein n=1 Tax=Rhizoclosmatium globosum TaxID=329046 RepID=A0A1Y2CTX1_9FUNG|nr:hypothetical protein BCR33DRAFT_713264 [Rhizoclosmatium globosum]|eukprot:ORY50471.1 hypothetical protein BCR33DRAFT_713264 [Rhizoclosmatium globosum]
MTTNASPLNSPPLTTSATTLASLSIEELQEIMLWLPFNPSILEFALTSKHIFSASVYGSVNFSLAFLTAKIAQSGNKDVWDWTRYKKIKDEWKHFPFNIQVAMFHHMLTGPIQANPIEKALQKESYFINLCMCITEAQALDLVDTLVTEFKYDSSMNSDRLLRWSCSLGNDGIVRKCLENSATDPSVFANLPLNAACSFGHSEIMEMLLNDPRLSTENLLKTLVMFGLEKELEKWLLDPRVDPSAKENDALHQAIVQGHNGIFKLLLADPRVNPVVGELLFGTARYNRLEMMDLVLQDPRVTPPNAALNTAVNRGYTDIVKRLLKDGRVDPANHANQCICVAAQSGFAEICEVLLTDPSVDPSARRNLPLIKGIQNGFLEVVRVLVADPRVDPAANGNLEIGFAARFGNIEICKLLLADWNVDPSANDHAAFMFAIETENFPVVELFLKDARIDPNCDDNAALQVASSWKMMDVILMNPRFKSNTLSMNQLYQYIQEGSFETSRKLLSDVRISPKLKGSEILLDCVRSGNIRVLKLILEDPSVRELEKGFAAVAIANKLGNKEMGRLLMHDDRITAQMENVMFLGV